MKQIGFTIMMFTAVLTGCSTDDVTIINEDAGTPGIITVVPLSEPGLGICADAMALGGTASVSAAPGLEVTFQWNNSIEHSADMTYVSYIELAEDTTCPNPAWAATPVASTYPIDVFNTSSLVIPGVSAKCFNWRIVINGYVGSALECTTTSDWKSVSYVQ